ncbi:val start codon [Burkholderia pseudomallei 1710b]|uniref:Val start codon n=1 Tax=Burkholderia pseudomallei (strain 1710b) TaxID=320372 RepID=Q3JPX4_BURP1|nr:val start codon [Burkholderia pseudomallei 1710b]
MYSLYAAPVTPPLCARRAPARRSQPDSGVAALHRIVVGIGVRLGDLLQTRKLGAFIETDECNTLRRPPHLANLRHARADQHARRRDQHDLILGVDERRGNDAAVALGGLDRDHPLRAAPVARVLGDRRALAVAVLGRGQHRLFLAARDEHRDHLLGVVELHPAHAARLAAHRPHVVLVETHRLAGVGEQHHVVRAVGDRRADQVIAVVEANRDDALLHRAAERFERRLLDRAQSRRHEHVLVGREFLHGQHDIDLLAVLQREHVDDRTAARVARALRHLVHLDPVHAAAVREAQDVVVRVRDEQRLDPVVFLHLRRLLAAAAALLRAVLGQRLRLHVARVRHRDHHVLRRDQVFGVQLGRVQLDLRAARIAELRLHLRQFVADQRRDPLGPRENVEQIGDLRHHVAIFADDLVLLEAREALQAHLEDFLRLRVGQPVQAVALHAERRTQALRTVRVAPAGRRVLGFRAREHVAHERRIPRFRHQLLLRDRRRRRGFDDRDELVDVRERDGEAFEHVAALARLAQFVDGAPRQHFAPMRQEALQDLPQIQELRLVVDERDHVHAERVLQLSRLVQVVQHHLGHFAALELDHDAHAALVGFVADVGDALELLLVDELRDPLEQRALVDLVRQFVDDDRHALAAVDLLEVRGRAHHDAPAPGAIAVAHAGDAVDDAGRREIGRGDDLDQFVDARLRIVQQVKAGVDDLVQVVRRDVGRHADRDPRRTVDEEVRNPRRQDERLHLAAVVVRAEVDGFLVDVREQFVADLGHPDFGVAHRGRVIAVDRAEVALAVDEHVTQREILSHPDDRVVDRGVAVRMVLTDHVADDTRGLLVRPVPVVVQLVHREQHAPVHGLQAIANIRKGTADDHAHGVIEIRLAHFLLEGGGQGLFGELIHVSVSFRSEDGAAFRVGAARATQRAILTCAPTRPNAGPSI